MGCASSPLLHIRIERRNPNWPHEVKKEKEYPPMPANWMYKRGDVYMMDLNPYSGSEQGGIRPAIVVQNDDGKFLLQCSSGRSADNTDQKAKYANAFYSTQSLF